MSFIEIKNVSRFYKSAESNQIALNNVSLSIEQGSFIVILGPSGSGKSTLLNLIGGLDSPSSGEIIVNGENITGFSRDRLSEYRAEKIGFVFQNYNLIPTLTVEENLSLINRICKNTIPIDTALEMVELERCKKKFPFQLSGGEQQRVSIARALIKNPNLLLCDEPTGALDSKTGAKVFKIIMDLSEKHKKTTIVVTHNQEIAKTADIVIKLRSGELVSVEKNLSPCSVSEIEW